MHYRVLEKWRIVLTTAEGEITAEDLESHAEALAKDVRAGEFDELTDLTRVTSASATTEAVRRMGMWLRDEDTNRPGAKLAIVAPSDAAFGMGRLYQAHRDHPDIEIRVFRDMSEGLTWLGVSPDEQDSLVG